MHYPSEDELKILKALRELGEADPRGVGSKIGIGSEMPDYICRYLRTKGLVEQLGKRYTLTEMGQKALEGHFSRNLALLRRREQRVIETLARIRMP